MLYSLFNAQTASVAGLRNLLLAPFAVAKTTLTSEGQIASITGLSGWQRFECPTGSSFGEDWSRTKNGKQYAQALGVQIGGLTAKRRLVLQALFQQGPVVALCLDYQGQWWLYGADFGLQVPKLTAKDGYAFTLEGTQRQAARMVSKSLLNLIYNSTFTPRLP